MSGRIESRSSKRLSRRDLTPAERLTATWREPDISLWSVEEQRRYTRLKSGLIAYLAGDRVDQIQRRYDLHISQIHEQLWRAMQLDGDDQALGFMALIPRLQVVDTVRRKPLPKGMHPSASACKGGLSYILNSENLYQEFVNKVLKRGSGPHPAVISALDLQRWLLIELLSRGYKKTQYPFNTRRPLYSSIARLIKTIQAENSTEHVLANETETAGANLSVNNGKNQRQTRSLPLEETEADEHNLHGIAAVRISIDGVDKLIPTERPVGIAILCRGTGAVLGGSVCLNAEAKEEALIEAIRSATIVGYVVRLPSGEPAPPFRACDFFPELSGAVWTVMCLDNARIHTGNRYQSTAAQIGAQSCFGPLRSWSARPRIEGTFGRMVNAHFSKMPSTTGSGPLHIGKRYPAEQAIKWEISHDDMARLFYEGLALINTDAGHGLLYQAPAAYLASQFKGPTQPIMRRLPPVSASTPEIGVHAVLCRVRRFSESNPNMYIHYGVKYTNSILGNRADLLSENIIVHPSTNRRTMLAFERNGKPLGTLLALGHWGKSDHTAEIQKLVARDKDKRFDEHHDKSPIATMLEKKAKEVVRKNRRRKHGGVVPGALELARHMQDSGTTSLHISEIDTPPTKIPATSTSAMAERARRAVVARKGNKP